MASSTILTSDEDANRIWRWVLAAQGLAGTTLDSSWDVAHASLGLHAARVASPYTTVASRISAQNAAGIAAELRHFHLLTLRCMRKTLHTMPIGLATISHAATMGYRIQHVRSMAAREGIAFGELLPVAACVEQMLRDEYSLSHREIETRLTKEGLRIPLIRLGLKLAWESGRVVYRNQAGSWHREQRTFAHPRHYPGFASDMDPELAQTSLIEEYFRRYGPASLKDAAWWSGLSQGRVARVLQGLDVIALQTSWASNPTYMLKSQFEAAESSSQAPNTRVAFLAHEDVALKAYFETRSRYLAGLAPRRAFNSIGEVLPTIVKNGHVIGTWRWDHRHAAIRYAQLRPSTPTLTAEVRAEASRMTRHMRAGYVANAALGR